MSNVVVGRITPLSTSSDPKVDALNRKLAQLLAADPEKVVVQMRQHREVVAGLRADKRALEAEVARKDRRIAQLIADLDRYECGCGIKAESIEDHECRPNTDGPDREVFECR